MSFAQEFITQLYGKLTPEDLKLVMEELDIFSSQFDINEKETHLATLSSFPDWYKTFFVAKKVKGCSDGTLRTYKCHLDGFFNYVNKDVFSITSQDILSFLYYLQTKGNPGQAPMSANVADQVRRILNSFFDWSRKNGYIDFNPVDAIDKIKGETKIRQPLSEIELETVRRSIILKKYKKSGFEKINIRNIAILETLYSTGARVSELAKLKISDVNFFTKEVMLYGKGNKHRISYLNAKAEVAIKEYLSSRTDNNPSLFVSYQKPYKEMTISGIRSVIKKSGVDAHLNDRLFPHRIRHTTATHALSHGMKLEEVQRLLGHEKPETTLIYAQIAQDNVHHSHQKCVI